MTPQDRKATAGTALSTSVLAAAKFYGVPASGTVPWGTFLGSDLTGNMYFGGALYPIGAVNDGDFLQRSGGTILGGTAVTPAGTQTLTNKRITPRVQGITSGTVITPDIDSYDQLNVTAQGAAGSVATPTGTPTAAQKFILRIKDDGTARALTFSSVYRAMGNTLPTTTILSKTLYLGFIYNSTDTKWDLVAKAQEA